VQRKEAARRQSLIKFVKKIVKKDEDRINGWAKSATADLGSHVLP